MTNLKAKKTILILVLLLVALCLSACGSVTGFVTTNENGEIFEIAIIELDANQVMSAGYNLEEVKNTIYLKATDEVQKLVQDYNFKKASTIITFGLPIITENDQNNEEDVCAVVENWTDNTLKIGLKFANEGVYKFFYDIPESATNQAKTESHFLYTKLSYNLSSIYNRNPTLYTRLYNYFNALYPQLITNTNGELFYTRTSKLHREHSNADYIIESNVLYYHTWKLDPTNPFQNIEIYYNIANQTNWIIICVGISVATTFILITIFVVRNKKNKRNHNKLLYKLKNKLQN